MTRRLRWTRGRRRLRERWERAPAGHRRAHRSGLQGRTRLRSREQGGAWARTSPARRRPEAAVTRMALAARRGPGGADAWEPLLGGWGRASVPDRSGEHRPEDRRALQTHVLPARASNRNSAASSRPHQRRSALCRAATWSPALKVRLRSTPEKAALRGRHVQRQECHPMQGLVGQQTGGLLCKV